MSTPSQHLVQIRSFPLPGLILSGLGGFVLLISVIMLFVAEGKPPFPGSQYIPVAVGAILLVLGMFLMRNRKVLVELTEDSIKLPGLVSPLPLKEISEIEYIKVPGEQFAKAFLVMSLTDTGKSLVTNPLAAELEDLSPQPDFGEEFDYFGYGPFERAEDFIGEVLRRHEVALAGETLEAPPEIPLSDRDTSETGEAARAYVHDHCGQATVVTGSSFYWCVNPMRFSGSGTICANCGQVMDETVRWAETGESLSRFRSRMWRHTPLALKLTQFIIVPGIVGVIAMVFAFGSDDVPVENRRMIGLGLGFLVTNMAIWLSRLGEILPPLFGMKYNKYL